MRILLTNDDGIGAEGLRHLYTGLTEAGFSVTCVAPINEMSAVGHAVTLASPLRVKEFSTDTFTGYGVQGTPADCVKLGITTLMDEPPELVVSGINAGANVGVDILYSGTVSAATEGALMGYPAIAASMDSFTRTELTGHAGWLGLFIRHMAETNGFAELPRRCVLNVNFPDCAIEDVASLKICRQTSAAYKDVYDTRQDPRGRPYHWLTGEIPRADIGPDSDRYLLTEGHITLTPLKFDFTDYATLDALQLKQLG